MIFGSPFGFLHENDKNSFSDLYVRISIHFLIQKINSSRTSTSSHDSVRSSMDLLPSETGGNYSQWRKTFLRKIYGNSVRKVKVCSIWTKNCFLSPSQLGEMETLVQTNTEINAADNAELPPPSAHSGRAFFPEETGGSLSILYPASAILPLLLRLNPEWLQLRGAVSFPLSSSPLMGQRLYLGGGTSENSGAPVALVTCRWDTGSTLGEASWGELGLLLPHPLQLFSQRGLPSEKYAVVFAPSVRTRVPKLSLEEQTDFIIQLWISPQRNQLYWQQSVKFITWGCRSWWKAVGNRLEIQIHWRYR